MRHPRALTLALALATLSAPARASPAPDGAQFHRGNAVAPHHTTATAPTKSVPAEPTGTLVPRGVAAPSAVAVESTENASDAPSAVLDARADEGPSFALDARARGDGEHRAHPPPHRASLYSPAGAPRLDKRGPTALDKGADALEGAGGVRAETPELDEHVSAPRLHQRDTGDAGGVLEKGTDALEGGGGVRAEAPELGGRVSAPRLHKRADGVASVLEENTDALGGASSVRVETPELSDRVSASKRALSHHSINKDGSSHHTLPRDVEDDPLLERRSRKDLAPDNVVRVSSTEKFCMIMPRDAHSSIGDSERPGGMQTFCSKEAKYSDKQGLIPDGFWKHVYYKTGYGVHGERFAQLTGCIRPRTLDRLNAADYGGQYDSSGGDHQRGNPESSVCIGYKHYVELVEPASSRACIRCCKDSADCPTDRDTQGCPNVIPGEYFDCTA